jgi:hypothetical protein
MSHVAFESMLAGRKLSPQPNLGVKPQTCTMIRRLLDSSRTYAMLLYVYVPTI